ncbi:unnamed protein product [Rotaria socialis]|uniref:Peptidase S9 prolyl oligopeptidase catalytic domain-containing protein n=4 Tax=Rotaria socialis TaxID=392032 RepID=A0A818RMG0_9BILA|nr:unnamed protein product [Rotaria socialis]
MRVYLFVIFTLQCYTSIGAHSKLTIDEFFNATSFQSVSLSPNGQHLLVYTRKPAWDLNSYDNSLWLYTTDGSKKELIATQYSVFMEPKWSPSGDWFFYYGNDKVTTNSTDNSESYRHSTNKGSENQQKIHLYSVTSDELLSIDIGKEAPSALTWSGTDSSLYFAAQSTESTEDDDRLYEAEWKDVIQYRRRKPNYGSVIQRIDIKRKHGKLSVKIHSIKHVDFIVTELLFVSSEHKIVCVSYAPIIETLSEIELYAIDLRDTSSLIRLTNSKLFEYNLKLSTDGKHVFFLVYPVRLNNENFLSVQGRLYSIDLTNGHIEQWGKGFQGAVRDYTIRSEGGVFILGQLGTNVHVYTQQYVWEGVSLLSGWHGSYRSISSSKSKQYSSVAVTYSSFEQPEEVYFTKDIDGLPWAKSLTHENQLLSTRDLPRVKLYRWRNPEDNRTIDGILHYPPGKFEHKNLPLFVLMHGGPTGGSLNQLQTSFDTWAPLAATEGWLVLEPNFRGSTGYGDKFIDEVLCEMLSRPGKDILAGVDSLISDGIADPTRLNIGGYSFGGFLTNWLITQTTRFNAAVSGAGASELVSLWGTTDFPTYGASFMCGLPWEVPEIYRKESIMNNLNKAQTPILISTGAKETRVPVDQSYILERSLTYLGVPVKLLLFPDEGHAFSNNPWHGKIKVREELKWLAQYDHLSSLGTEDLL